MSRFRRTRAFTLVELLIACTLMAILSVIFSGQLRGAVEVWRRVTNRIMDTQRERVVWSTLERDFANAVVYDPRDVAYGAATGLLPMPLTAQDRLQFFSATSPAGRSLEPVAIIGYWCGAVEEKKGLWRLVLPIGLARAGTRVEPRLLLSDCESLNLQYAVKNGKDAQGKLQWQPTWLEPHKNLPALVDVRITVSGGREWRRTIPVPAGTFILPDAGAENP